MHPSDLCKVANKCVSCRDLSAQGFKRLIGCCNTDSGHATTMMPIIHSRLFFSFLFSGATGFHSFTVPVIVHVTSFTLSVFP